MADYLNEDEQLEALKKWWNENGKKLLLATGAGLLLLVGYQAFNSQKADYAVEASSAYESVMLDVNQNKDINEQVQALKADYDNSVYAQFAAMQLAAQQVNKGDLDNAANELRWAAENDNDNHTHVLASLRLARVLLAQGKYDDAASVINANKSELYEVKFQELLGDVLYKQNKLEAAQTTYTEALQLAEANNEITPILRLKANSLIAQ